VQVLTIEGPVNFGGLIFGPDSIPTPFEDSFLRRMLENWAVLTSKYVDHLRPLNIPGSRRTFEGVINSARKRSSKTAHKRNHAEHAAALGALLNAALKAEIPGAAAIHPSDWRENLRTYQVQIPGRETFEVFLGADDSLITGNSDERRVDLLLKKVEAHLAGRSTIEL
jgi:hypothetical protein